VLFSRLLQRHRSAVSARITRLDTLGFRRYKWKCDNLNEPSKRAAVRLGFQFEGVRDVGIFGSDAPLFRHERWLEAGPEQLEKMEAAVGTLFGNGRHRCLGRTIALIELNKVISEACYCFHDKRI
jgi:RimJ/RimL family protein N-acetyltransferase